MKIIIEIEEFEDKEGVLNYFYEMCLKNHELKKFKVSIEDTELIKSKSN